MNFFDNLLNGDFMPHGHCFIWQEDLLWLNVGGDALTVIAYTLIPIALIFLVKQRSDLAFNWIFVMFAAFIFLCGLTHAIGIFNVWHGYYYLAGYAKVATGIISILTAVMAWKLMPKALAIPSRVELEAKNESLNTAQQELREINAHLEARIAERTRELEEIAQRDYLTNLYNRREASNRIHEELERSHRYKSDLTILLIDLDHFKEINDTFGHALGDQVLVEVARVFEKNCRTNDIAGRWGGEEFLFILPETSGEDALVIAERIRLEVESLTFTTTDGAAVSTRCSIGVAQFEDSDSETELISKTDKAMYRAKQMGRNRVVLWNSLNHNPGLVE